MFGAYLENVWQVTFEYALDEEALVEEMERYLALAQPGETVIACGYTLYSGTDQGTYYRHLGDCLRVWSDMVLSYLMDDDDGPMKNSSCGSMLWKNRCSTQKGVRSIAPRRQSGSGCLRSGTLSVTLPTGMKRPKRKRPDWIRSWLKKGEDTANGAAILCI